MSPISDLFTAARDAFSAQLEQVETLARESSHQEASQHDTSSRVEDQMDSAAEGPSEVTFSTVSGEHVETIGNEQERVDPTTNGVAQTNGDANGDAHTEHSPDGVVQIGPTLNGDSHSLPMEHDDSQNQPTTNGHSQIHSVDRVQVNPVPRAPPPRGGSPSVRHWHKKPPPLNAQHRLYPSYPPENYSAVEPSAIYRSGFPQEDNYAFISKLGLKTILTLVVSDEERPHPKSYPTFIAKQGIEHITLDLPANKGSVNITYELIFEALKTVINTEKLPLLIHCNKGRHRTGCIVACFRKLQGWCLADAIDEYVTIAQPKCRDLDVECIKRFDVGRWRDDAGYSRREEMDIDGDSERTIEETTPSDSEASIDVEAGLLEIDRELSATIEASERAREADEPEA